MYDVIKLKLEEMYNILFSEMNFLRYQIPVIIIIVCYTFLGLLLQGLLYIPINTKVITLAVCSQI